MVEIIIKRNKPKILNKNTYMCMRLNEEENEGEQSKTQAKKQRKIHHHSNKTMLTPTREEEKE